MRKQDIYFNCNISQFNIPNQESLESTLEKKLKIKKLVDNITKKLREFVKK